MQPLEEHEEHGNHKEQGERADGHTGGDTEGKHTVEVTLG